MLYLIVHKLKQFVNNPVLVSERLSITNVSHNIVTLLGNFSNKDCYCKLLPTFVLNTETRPNGI